MPEEPTQQPEPQPQPPPASDPGAGGGLSEADIQQAIANSADLIQKGEDQGGVERR